ncbi:hypothetical protein GIB67_019184, partial [Kingdonia uniflora]
MDPNQHIAIMIELIKPHYEGARGLGTRDDYNLLSSSLFKIILRASPILDLDSMSELIKPHYESARCRGTRGDYNLFKLILRASPMSTPDTMLK